MSTPRYWQDFPEITEQNLVSCTTVNVSDGSALNVYHMGMPPEECFVVLMPTSTPSLLMIRVAARLGQYLPVISWEPRGATFLPERGDCTAVTVHRHAQDVLDVAAQMGIRAIHLITWCSSADTAAQIVAARPELKILSVATIAPTLTYLESNASPFRKMFVPMLRALPDADEKQAEAICRSIRMLASLRIARDDDEATIHKLTFMNFSCADHIKHYAGLTRAFHRQPPPEQRRVVFQEMCQSVPTFMLCFEDDELVGAKLASRVAFGPSQLTTETHPKGGHFAPYRNPELVCASLQRFFGTLGIGASVAC